MVVARLRLAGADDVAVLTRLVGAMRDFLAQTEPDDATIATRLRSLLGETNTDFVLVEDGGQTALGYVQLRYRESLWYGREAEIEDLFLATAARRQGLGQQLLHFAVCCAEQRGCSVLGLQTNEQNLAAVGLYEACGFDARRARWHGGRQIWLVRELVSPQGMAG